jgi:hypothetical protein
MSSAWAGERVDSVRPEKSEERVEIAAKSSDERDSRRANSDSSQIAAVCGHHPSALHFLV